VTSNPSTVQRSRSSALGGARPERKPWQLGGAPDVVVLGAVRLDIGSSDTRGAPVRRRGQRDYRKPDANESRAEATAAPTFVLAPCEARGSDRVALGVGRIDS